MVVKLLKNRQHVVPSPARQAELSPMVVIRRLASHRDHGVDGRAAADNLAAWIGQRAPVQARLRLGPEHPVRTRIADRKKIAHGNVEPNPVIVATRLKQQHPYRGIGGQPVCYHATRRASAHHNVIETSFQTGHVISP